MNEFVALIPWVKIYIFISILSTVSISWVTITTMLAQKKAMKEMKF